jgi:NAD(P)-dependent dehydrogenase (short-subunit alcohol dehydrogenase family)
MTRIALSTGGKQWECDRLDIFVSNAGLDGHTPFGQTDTAIIDALYAVHVKGPMLLTELLAPMVNDGGRVVFTSSGRTRYVANPVLGVRLDEGRHRDLHQVRRESAWTASDHGQRPRPGRHRYRLRRRAAPVTRQTRSEAK